MLRRVAGSNPARSTRFWAQTFSRELGQVLATSILLRRRLVQTGAIARSGYTLRRLSKAHQVVVGPMPGPLAILNERVAKQLTSTFGWRSLNRA